MRKLSATLLLTIAVLLESEVRGSDLPACKDTIYEAETKTWDRCIGAWKYNSPNSESTAEYKGEWQNGKRTGYGILILKISKFRLEKYEGEFKDGKRTGHGTYSFANGDRYVGNFINGKKIGKENTPLQTVIGILVNFKVIKCMVKAYTYTQREEFIVVYLRKAIF